MKLRVDTAPPCSAADTRHIFGTVFFVTSPRFISRPAASRTRSTRAFSSASASSSSGASWPVLPKSDARITTTGMPLSISVASTPSTTSRALPVGSSAPPVLEPAMSRKSITIGAAVPGTPSMRASPSYRTRPPGVCTVATAMLAVFTMWMRTFVSPSAAATRPFSIANGPIPASMLPQFCDASTRGSSGTTCRNR